MDRRNSISALFGQNQKSSNQKTLATPPPAGDLDQYTGPWTIKEASHLMRRATFGPDQELIKKVVEDGLSKTVKALFDNAVPSAPPVRYSLDSPDPDNDIYPVAADPNVAFGETWINEPPVINTGNQRLDEALYETRIASVYAWNFLNMMESSVNIMPKLWLFWHNHFVVSDFQLPLEMYQYANLIEQHAKGNFRQLTKDMTINVAMLRYLDGTENSKNAPNENYARELLELFTVGKGALAGPGDYTTFTEQDVQAISRVLTGWVINRLALLERLEPEFRLGRHDRGTKQLSNRFGNAVIPNSGTDEYKLLIDIIFEQEATAMHICRKLYRYFLNSEINDDIESRIIAPMASMLRANDYNIEPVVSALLSSEHFYSEEAIGCMIKNPIDFIMSATKGLDFKKTGDLSEDHFFAVVYYLMATEQDMSIYSHPDVAGWKAYYQEPQFYRTWINTFYLPKRNKTTAAFAGGGSLPIGGRDARIPQLINVILYVLKVPNASDPNQLIYNIAANMFSYQITEAQKDYLKEILIAGLPDFEWTVEYSEFLADPDDPAKGAAINNKLVALFAAMLEMPEFQLM